MFNVGEKENNTTTMDQESMEVDDIEPSTSNKPQAFADDSELDAMSISKFYVDLFTAAGLSMTPKKMLNNHNQKQTLTYKVKEALLPFLRSTALFAFLDTDVPMPSKLMGKPGTPSRKISVSEEYRLLCSYLGITTRINTLLETVQLRDLALMWARHPKLAECFYLKGEDDDQISCLTPIHECLQQPHTLNKLIQLPEEYTTLINSVAHFTCPTSRSYECRYPTMCLICGEIVCAQNYCCQRMVGIGKDEPIGAANFHARQCGAGMSIFLRIRDCKIMLLTTEGRGEFVRLLLLHV